MTFEEFTASLRQEQPPAEINELLRALWLDKKGNWDGAHAIAQSVYTREGSRLHAYLHREEGDQWNAGYWYSRAGETKPDIPLEKEWEMLVKRYLEHPG